MMLDRLRSAFRSLSYLVFWILVAGLAALTAFQLHGTLITISIAIIEEPALRPSGWTMDTTHGLGRVFWLILGLLWLGGVTFAEGYLRDGKEQQTLVRRFLLLLLILAVIYGLSYGVLLFLY